MKTRFTGIAPVITRIPRMATATAMGIETLQTMKTRLTLLKLFIVVCCTFATTAVFGQTTRTWTGLGDGVTIGNVTNWSGSVLPGNTDTAQFDGTVGGNLLLNYNGGIGGNFEATGCSWSFTPSQTGSVTIKSPVANSANLAVNHLTNSAGVVSFGDGTANLLNIIWRANGGAPVNGAYTPHQLINNSASPITIYPNVRFQAGGGNTHPLVFRGSGNWLITNSLYAANNTPTLIEKQDSGTLLWAGPSITAALGNNVIASPVNIQGGTMILKFANALGTQRITNNGTMLEYDTGTGATTLSGPMHGAGLLRVSSGTLTLSSGASDFTGNIELNNSSTLVVGGGENPGISGPLGSNGVISFNGGTLKYSAANNFDYSSRFSTAASQAYKFDTAGQLATLATGLGSSGGTLTKVGSGSVTLSGTSSYDGLTTISAGKLVFQGSKTGTGSITVADSAVLGVAATGTQVTPTTLALGTSGGASLEVYDVSSTNTAPVNAGTLTSAGTLTVNIIGGTFTAGHSYPLLHWTSGSAPTVALGITVGAVGTLSIVTNTVKFTVSEVALTWDGATDGSWDTTTANNWLLSGSPTLYADTKHVAFSDAATGQTNVTITGALQPGSSTIYNNSKIYSITSSVGNNITGSKGLSKGGIGTLTLSGGANAYTGITTFFGGAVNASTLTDGGAASDVGSASSDATNQVFNGGALQYTGGGASVNRLFTLATGGGTISALGSGALALNNSGSAALTGTGARVITLTGTNTGDNTLAATLGDNGGATSLTKSGSGKWVVSGNNTNSGVTTITAGTLQVGAGGANGSLGSGDIIDNGGLIFNRTGTLTNGVISGSGSVVVDGGGTIVLPGNNTYTGGTTITNGTLQVGNGGATGSLNGGSAIANNGTVIFNSTGSFSYTAGGLISGAGNVIVRGSGVQKFIGANSYTGWTLIDAGATFQPCEGNQGALASSVVTNNGTLKLVRQDTAVFTYAGNIVGSGQVVRDVNNFLAGDVRLTGSNTYTGGTIIQGGELIIGNGTTVGSITGNVLFTNSPVEDVVRTLTFNHSDTVIFPGLITYSTNLAFGNRGIVQQSGGGTLILTADNDYPGGTVINAGILQVGNGGPTGAIGTGPVTDNSLLVFNRSGALTYNNVISGSGPVFKMGSGTVTLNGACTYGGSTVVSNGTLIVNNTNFAASTIVYGGTLGGTGLFFGPVTLEAGTTLAPGASVGTMTIDSDLSIGGNLAIEVDKSLVQSNDLVAVSGVLANTGTGTLTVANLGPALTVGDKFTLFSQAVGSGAALTVTGGGATWTNNLADDGSISVLTVLPTTPPTLNFTNTGTGVQLSWTGAFKLQSQTNTLSVGLKTNWSDYPGGGTSPVTATFDKTKGTILFRLAPTP